MDLVNQLKEEDVRSASEGLNEAELGTFDLLIAGKYSQKQMNKK